MSLKHQDDSTEPRQDIPNGQILYYDFHGQCPLIHTVTPRIKDF